MTMATRKPNFSTEELEVLVNSVKAHYQHLFGQGALKVDSRQKAVIWASIAGDVAAVGSCARTVAELKHKWRDLRTSVKSRIAASHRHASATGGQLNEVEQIVASTLCGVDVIGEEGGVDTDEGKDWS